MQVPGWSSCGSCQAGSLQCCFFSGCPTKSSHRPWSIEQSHDLYFASEPAAEVSQKGCIRLSVQTIVWHYRSQNFWLKSWTNLLQCSSSMLLLHQDSCEVIHQPRKGSHVVWPRERNTVEQSLKAGCSEQEGSRDVTMKVLREHSKTLTVMDILYSTEISATSIVGHWIQALHWGAVYDDCAMGVGVFACWTLAHLISVSSDVESVLVMRDTSTHTVLVNTARQRETSKACSFHLPAYMCSISLPAATDLGQLRAGGFPALHNFHELLVGQDQHLQVCEPWHSHAGSFITRMSRVCSHELGLSALEGVPHRREII